LLVETRRNLIDPDGRMRLDAVRLDRMLKLMRSRLPQALVHGYESRVPQFVGHTYSKDEHAAAGVLKCSKAAYGRQVVVLVTCDCRSAILGSQDVRRSKTLHAWHRSR
jgi:hypothetical protein